MGLAEMPQFGEPSPLGVALGRQADRCVENVEELGRMAARSGDPELTGELAGIVAVLNALSDSFVSGLV